MHELRCRLLGALAASALLIAPAAAQKSQETLRVALSNPISTIFVENNPDPETDLASRAVFDELICYDHQKLEFAPLLAQSWTQVNDTTLDLKLRDDVVFHDGTKFTVDDAVYSLNYLRDPNNKLRFASENLSWIAGVEKTGDDTLRIVAKQPTAVALLRLATSAPMLPAKLHAALADKSDFGLKVNVGTGPYKAVSVDPTAGVSLVRNDAYHQANPCKPAGTVGKVRITQIPDAQTQIAQLMTGGIDLTRTTSKDQADLLAMNPLLSVTASEGISFYFMSIDAVGRTGNKALTELKVRQAMARTLDRKALAAGVIAGGNAVQPIDAMCLPNHRGCDYSTTPPAFDLAAAKALLTEAGYPDGFDTEITAIPGGGNMAEAVAGELRKIGIRAKVDKPTFAGYRSKQRDGKTEIIIGTWTLGGLPDVSPTIDYFFDGGPRDYIHDSEIAAWAKESVATLDEGKRKAIDRQLFDRVNTQSYIVPLTTSPSVFVHSKDVAVAQGSFSNYGADLYEMSWR
jgi:peptide/nickel transport system substrate-binding protein